MNVSDSTDMQHVGPSSDCFVCMDCELTCQFTHNVTHDTKRISAGHWTIVLFLNAERNGLPASLLD